MIKIVSWIKNKSHGEEAEKAKDDGDSDTTKPKEGEEANKENDGDEKKSEKRSKFDITNQCHVGKTLVFFTRE